MSELITISNLEKTINEVTLFSNVNMHIKKNGFYGLKGDSGSGKSTFLFILGLLDNDYHGDVLILNQSIKTIKDKEKYIKNHIGFVFQNPIFINEMTIKENLFLFLNKNEKNEIEYLLEKVQLSKKKNEKVKNLSGGERIRLSLVRALSNNPDILLCDEPTGSLNPEMAQKIMEILKEESKKRAVFIVSHDIKLLNEYVDEMYELNNKTITRVKENEIISNQKCITKINTSNSLSFNFIIKYLKSAFQKNKLQTFICIFSLILCFLTLGLSSFLNNEVSLNIKESFNSLIEKDQILLKGDDIQEKNESISVSYFEAKDIVNESKYFYDVNYLYFSDFETQFKDANYMLLLGENTIPFYDVGLRTISETILLDDIPLSNKVYPYRPVNLDMNEGVLGLRKRDIRKICSALNLDNLDINTLAKYLTYHVIDFCFYFQNESWGYNNEVLFRMKAFFISEESIIIAHTDSNYVTNFIEEKMKLPISNDLLRSEYLPWTIKRATYIRVRKENEYSALKEYFSSNYYKDYDLEKVKGNLASNFFSSSFHECKYIVTYASKGKIPFGEISKMINNNDINYAFPVGIFYPVIEEAMVSGFANSLFISSQEDALIEVEDYYSSIKENIDGLDLSKVDFNPRISCGNLITSAMQKGLKLETKKPVVSKGRYPENEYEIVISSKLANKLYDNGNAINERIYFLNNQYDQILFNTFQKSSAIICGIYNCESERIYQEELWYPSFLTINFNYPLENIYINSYICQSEKEIKYLNEAYTGFSFLDPLEKIYESIDSVINMIEIILYLFIVLLVISAIGILFIALDNIMQTASKEIGLFVSLGTNKKSIFLLYVLYGVSYSFIAMIISIIGLLFSSVIIKIFCFNLPLTLNINFLPYKLIFYCFLIITFPLCIFHIIIPLNKKSLFLLKRYY